MEYKSYLSGVPKNMTTFCRVVFEIIWVYDPLQPSITLFQYYLSPEDFQKLFQVSLTDYEKLPQWKKSNLKKKVGLY